MDNFDLLFARVNDIGLIQQELKKEVAEAKEEQKVISKQVQANGQAVATLTLRQMDTEANFDITDGASLGSVEDQRFDNIFAKDTQPQPQPQPESSKRPLAQVYKESLPHNILPKMQFPAFDGHCPKIWIDKCCDYFTIYNVGESLKVTRQCI